MKCFGTKNDLRNWVDTAMGADANGDIVEAVTNWIWRDEKRPHWESDWTEYLATLDLWHIATGLGL